MQVLEPETGCALKNNSIKFQWMLKPAIQRIFRSDILFDLKKWKCYS